MKLIDELRAEHDRIEPVASSLRTYARELAAGTAGPADAAAYLRFFRLYAGAFHHGREEDTLFVALQREAELPGDRGPIATLLADHHAMAELLAAMETHAAAAAMAAFAECALQYSEQLLHHIDAENSVLLPESEERLRRCGAAELPTRAPTDEEESARVEGLRLLAAWPPVFEPAIMRGDGCVFCAAYANTCRGVEREWWNEWEWAEAEDRLDGG
ncbi:MAG: hemerythrin domain-containing protein [Vicinamibacteria bacterium]|nr:hemerythrin domain-containing protein [Vicinamibacteria bacterium]